MATASQLIWYLSGGAGNSDPNASLGGARSTTTRLDFEESTLTATPTALNQLVDTAQIGNPNGIVAGDWVLVIDGAAALEASEVLSFDSGTGTFQLRGGLETLATSGDGYRLFHVNNLFDDVDAAEASAGDVEHRCVMVRNESGANVTDMRVYVLWPDTSLQFGVAVEDTVNTSPTSIADEDDVPDLTGFGQSRDDESYTTPFSRASSFEPLGTPGIVGNNQHRALWVRRTVRSTQFGLSSVAALLVAEGNEGGAEPGAALVVFSVTGFTPSLAVTPDRGRVDPDTGQARLSVAGGARIEVVVTTVEDGLPIEDVPIEWTITAGVGTLSPEASERTDEDGLNSVPYASTNQESDAGSTVTVQARLA